MGVSGDKKSIRISLDISPPFSHIVSQLVQALVITYDETFQTLAVKGDVLLTKPVLDLGFDGVVRRKSPASEVFFRFPKHVDVQDSRVGVTGWVGWSPELASGVGRPRIPPGLGKSHRMS
jgi:hypothetical protein